ncbi:S-layer homology domain-containing protein [Lysinibacillus sp. NPDC056959]|uniref:S-layer homology domain-containing protein n=1 Tax=Lysinibacillus sp. NPDC056959 TaxID=3345981 RepID=UPI00362BAA8D
MKKIYLLLIPIITCFLVLPSTSLAATFSDVPPSHPNYDDINYLLDMGVIDKSSKYGISDIVTREEVAVMIAKATGLDGAQRTTKFSDVLKSNKNSGYIQSAVEAGIINGYGDNTFKPTAKVTRGQMAAFIARAFDLPKGNKFFMDVPEEHYAYEAVKQLAAAGITTGYDDGTFKPEANLSRAHISAFLARTIKYQVEQENNTSETTTEQKITISEERLWDYLDSPFDFKGDLGIRVEDVYLTSEFLRVIVHYTNNGVYGGGIYDTSTKINDKDAYDFEFNYKMKEKYGSKDAPAVINFLDGTVTNIQYFKPSTVEGDTVTLTFSFGGKHFTFKDVKIRQ